MSQEPSTEEQLAQQRIELLAQTAEETPPAQILGGGIVEDVIQTEAGPVDGFAVALLVLPVGSPRAFRVTFLVDKVFGERLGFSASQNLPPVTVTEDTPEEGASE